MKLVGLLITLLLNTFLTFGQESYLETARTFMRSGDFDNAIVVLNRGLQQDKKSLELQKELIQCYYFKRDYVKAVEGVKAIIDREDADVITFQIAGNVYKALEDAKEGDKVYKKGLKKFPKSGPLYSEYGELLWAKNDYAAINWWEKGIEVDPGYGGNYYNAALFYFYTKDKVWSLIYGEIFVNMESLSRRGAAMKELLLKAYKEKLFAEADLLKGEEKNKSPFAKSFLECMGKQASQLTKGVNTESLTMVRTRFILEWYENYAAQFPFRLFDFHQQLLREGLFDAYNQWLFGAVENLPAFDAWTRTHAEPYALFTKLQKSSVFRMPAGQYYQVR